MFKLGLLSFWSLWHGIVLLTNLFEGLKVLHVLPARWTFASKNYEAIVRATEKYHPAPWIPRLLFGGVLLWQVLILVGFGWAMVISVGSASMDLDVANIAFGLSLSLLAAFIIADELCTEYDTEHGHILFFHRAIGHRHRTHRLATLTGSFMSSHQEPYAPWRTLSKSTF